jgi:solute carrier family 13 (sodium-dependent dicarboxylate transporter), member 2/3/5
MSNPSSDDYGRRQRIGIFLGPVVFLFLLLLPPPEGLAPEAWAVAGVALFMAIWWVTEAIPIPATALLPIVLFPILKVGSVADATRPFANPLIYLFMGGFIIALAMEKQICTGALRSMSSSASALAPDRLSSVLCWRLPF